MSVYSNLVYEHVYLFSLLSGHAKLVIAASIYCLSVRMGSCLMNLCRVFNEPLSVPVRACLSVIVSVVLQYRIERIHILVFCIKYCAWLSFLFLRNYGIYLAEQIKFFKDYKKVFAAVSSSMRISYLQHQHAHIISVACAYHIFALNQLISTLFSWDDSLVLNRRITEILSCRIIIGAYQ